MIQFSLNVDPIYIIIYFSAVQKMNSVKWGEKVKVEKAVGRRRSGWGERGW